LIIVILLGAFKLVFPEYLKAGGEAISETFYVIQYGETKTGQLDERLGLSRPFITKKFKESPFFGTGFDNRWKNEEGDLQGYEASDYPFLGALAMVGIIGILLFIPIYFFIINAIRKDIILLRKLTTRQGIFQLFIFTGILFFIYDLFKYMDYFSPVSLSGAAQFPWYAYLGIYLGARRAFIRSYRSK
jgi:hypothetical protein